MNQVITNGNYNGVLQKPLHTGFSARTTSQELMHGVDISGRVVIVTGGSSGIGLETVRTLSSAGAEVWVPARNMAKAKTNLDGIRNVRLEEMDLMNPASVDQFALNFLSSGKALHLLINNAGIMWVPLVKDARGYESQLATNHLAHFQLTARLWPALKNAYGARVINVSSFGHQIAPFNFDDPNFNHREYQTLLGYGQSKTANNLFAVELDRRGMEYGIRSYSLHPGSVSGTDLGREAPIELYQQMGSHDEQGRIKPEFEAKLKTIPQGAATTIWCATSLLLDDIGGVYCEDCDIAELDLGQLEKRFDEPSSLRGVQPYSVDKENAQRLWKLSEEMTGVSFTTNQ